MKFVAEGELVVTGSADKVNCYTWKNFLFCFVTYFLSKLIAPLYFVTCNCIYNMTSKMFSDS